MDNLNTDTHPTSIPAKRRFWGRFLFRGMLVGGIFLVLLLTFLVAVTVPNLRREVAPPEISGPGQVERNTSESSTSPTLGTLTVTDSTSGTQSFLNLDDYPHLSPKMRELTQAWLDRVSGTDKVLETIPDPVKRDQARTFLKEQREKIHAVLALPQNRDRQAFQNMNRWYFMFPENVRLITDTFHMFLSSHPKFEAALNEEGIRFCTLSERMAFEFYVREGDWALAATSCATADRNSSGELSSYRRWEKMNSWEEEVYCLRQMGVPGWACLAGRSYQRALDSLWHNQPPANRFQYNLRTLGYLPMNAGLSIFAEKTKENESAPKNSD